MFFSVEGRSKRCKRHIRVGAFQGFIIGLLVMFGFALFIIPINASKYVPSDRIQPFDIHKTLDNGTTIIHYPGVYYTEFSGTGSMRPVLDKEALGIWTKNFTPDNIKIGDVIHYNPPFPIDMLYPEEEDLTIAHRVVDIFYDTEGLYFKTKGDTLLVPDTYKVREEHLIGVLVGVLY